MTKLELIATYGGSTPLLDQESLQALDPTHATRLCRAVDQTKFMRCRCVSWEKEGSVNFWLFDMPDFTQIFKDWYTRYLSSVFVIHQPDASAALYADQRFLLLHYQGVRPSHIVSRFWINKDYPALDKLLKDTEAADHHLASALTADIPQMVTKLTHFSGFGLDVLFPEDLVLAKWPTMELSRLYATSVSAWGTLYDRSLNLLDQTYAGEISEREAVERLADEASYLRWGDIDSWQSDWEFSTRHFAGLKRRFKNGSALWQYWQARQESRRMLGHPLVQQARYMDNFKEQVPEGDHELLEWTARFAAAAQHYNEQRRIYTTAGLRKLRDAAEKLSLDWETVSLDSLVKSASNQKEVNNDDTNIQRGFLSPNTTAGETTSPAVILYKGCANIALLEKESF